MEMKFKEIDLLESRLDILPEHTLEEQREIKQSIMKDGQKVPVVVDQKGFVVDGRLRFEILRDLGKECKYTVEKFKTESDVIRYMLVANLQRRNLNTFQKIEAHVMLYNALSRQLQKEHKKGAGMKIANKLKAIDIFAEEMKISARTIGSSFWLMKHAPLEILAQLRNGTTSINKAWVECHGYDKRDLSPRGVTLRRLFNFFPPGSVEYAQLQSLVSIYEKTKEKAKEVKN